MAVTSKGLAVVLACVVAGQSMSGRQAAGGGSQAARTKGSCRTYDTSATAVTVAGPLRATLTYAGTYDPGANRFTLNVTYSDNRDLRYSYVQVTTYDSTEDFIAEVVRLKAPASLSSNKPGPAVNVVPPLTRSLRTIASGRIVFTLTNSYDTQGRLTGSVNAMPSGNVTTRYTVWDRSGRPTAGTLQSSASSSTLALSYNDQAGTVTTTTTTGSFVAVGTQTFDANGNPTVYVQRSNTGPGVSTTTTTSGSTATVCMGGGP